MSDISEVPVQAWLSYRCKSEVAIAQRDELKKLCDAQGIRLVYDQSDAGEGDDLIAFMNDLTAARCVFIFLSPDYFQSAYTLFELVSIHERADLERRFILPVRLTDDMVTYQWTAAKDGWIGNAAVRNELARLLQTGNSDADHEQLWQRIDVAWHGVVFPYLDTLRQSLEAGKTESLLANRVADLKNNLDSVVAQTKKDLHSLVIREVQVLLDSNYLPSLPFFQRELRLGRENTSHDVAVKLVGMPASHSIAALTRLMRHQRKAAKGDDWEISFEDARQLCGWLLINTVSPVWWFQHELRWKQDIRKGKSSSLSLESSEFIEVIISRTIIQPAIYELDERRQKVKMPYALDDQALVFDAVSEGAQEEEILIELYRALFRLAPPTDLDNEKMLARIYERAHSFFMRDRQKTVYYLVDCQKLSLLQALPFFRKVEQKLAGYLHFICCQQAPKGYEQSPCEESQRLLLDQVALLLSMQTE